MILFGWFDGFFGEIFVMGMFKGICGVVFVLEIGWDNIFVDLSFCWFNVEFVEDLDMLLFWIVNVFGVL